MAAPGLIATVLQATEAMGVDLQALGLAWARTLPTVTLVPAFGLRALPGPARFGIALALAACIAPALSLSANPVGSGLPSLPWPVALVIEIIRGLPVALAAAVPLWTATMAGGTMDALRGVSDTTNLAVVDGRASPLGVLCTLLASAAFLASGGPARVTAALLALPPDTAPPVAHVAMTLSSGISIAVGIAAPLVAASLVVEVALALLARAASPTQIQALVSQLRSMVILGVLALLWERIAAVLMALGARPLAG